MLETVLLRKNSSTKIKISVKSAVSAALVICALVLPQIVHIFAGAVGGVKFLPMYLPVLLGGLLLGKVWGAAVGMLCPVISFAVTSAFGSPMPILTRVPYMMAELAVFALVCGAFSKKVMQNKYFAFLAVISAFLAGRLTFLVLSFATQSFGLIAGKAVAAQITNGVTGTLIQCVLVPVIAIALRALLLKDKNND